MKKHIPNLLTLGNLFSGTVAVIFAVKADYDTAAILVIFGIIFDFFDGFVARLLNVSGELGKQLDSLADMVTSGVVPGIIMFQLLKGNYFSTLNFQFEANDSDYLPLLGLLLTLGACYRLAKFNLDTRQTSSFIGLPTPAMSLFVISLILIPTHFEYVFINKLLTNQYILIAITLVLTYLMNANIYLFSLKFKNLKFKGNEFKYFLIVGSMILVYLLSISSIPLIIILYIFLSQIKNITTNKEA